jgi:hypothetical protein
MSDVNAIVQQAISAYKANDKAKARELLLQAVDLDEHNEQAWMWMSTVVDSLEEQQICLENVIQINPNNERAKKGLVVIKEKLGMSGAAAPPPASAADASNPWEGTGFDSNPFSAFDQPAPPPADPATHGSGATGDPTTGEQYDNWIDSLGISEGVNPSPPGSAPPAPANDDPWASLGSSSSGSNPFASDSNAASDSWGSDSAKSSSGSNPFYTTDDADSDPWGTVTGVDPWAASSSQSAPASDPFGTSTPQQEEAPAAEEPPPERESVTANFEFAEESEPQYTSFDFDEAEAIDSGELEFGEDDLEDHPFEEDDFSDFDPFADEVRPKIAPEGSSYLELIPAELRSSGGGSNAGSILLVAVLLLLNLAAVAGLLVG